MGAHRHQNVTSVHHDHRLEQGIQHLLRTDKIDELSRKVDAIPILQHAIHTESHGYAASCVLDLMASRLSVHDAKLNLPSSDWNTINLTLIGIGIGVQRDVVHMPGMLNVLEKHSLKEECEGDETHPRESTAQKENATANE